MSIPKDRLTISVEDYNKTLMMVLTLRYERLLKLEEKHLKALYNAAKIEKETHEPGVAEFCEMLIRERKDNLQRSIDELKKTTYSRLLEPLSLPDQINQKYGQIQAMHNRIQMIVILAEMLIEAGAKHHHALLQLKPVVLACKNAFKRMNVPVLKPANPFTSDSVPLLDPKAPKNHFFPNPSHLKLDESQEHETSALIFSKKRKLNDSNNSKKDDIKNNIGQVKNENAKKPKLSMTSHLKKDNYTQQDDQDDDGDVSMTKMASRTRASKFNQRRAT